MKAKQTGIWPPLCECLTHRVVIGRIFQSQALPFTTRANTDGNRGGFSPRKRRQSSWSCASFLAYRQKAVVFTCTPQQFCTASMIVAVPSEGMRVGCRVNVQVRRPGSPGSEDLEERPSTATSTQHLARHLRDSC